MEVLTRILRSHVAAFGGYVFISLILFWFVSPLVARADPGRVAPARAVCRLAAASARVTALCASVSRHRTHTVSRLSAANSRTRYVTALLYHLNSVRREARLPHHLTYSRRLHWYKFSFVLLFTTVRM